MPASLKSITSKRATIFVPIDPANPDSDKVRVVYRPKALTERAINRFNDIVSAAADNELAGGKQTIELFVTIVESWDLLADPSDTDPIPLTYEGLADVPTAFLNDVIVATSDDQKPDPTTKTS